MFIADSTVRAIAFAVGRSGPSVRAMQNHQPTTRAAAWAIPGFLGKVRVLTAFGALPIEALRVNDPIRTVTGRNLSVQRIKRIGLDDDFLVRHPEAHPIKIATGAFAHGFPEQDMLISPAQELTVALGNLPPQRMRAGDIKGNSSVVRAPQETLIYYSFELGEAAYVYVEGLPVLIPLSLSAQQDEEDQDE